MQRDGADDDGAPGDARQARTAAALIIGTELLSGKIADKNLSVLAQTLQGIGVRLVRAVTVLDDLDTIASEVRGLSGDHDHLFTSGGVGPTHDDLTIDAVAAAFGVGVESSPAIEAMLRRYYGDDITDGHLRMARIPVGARLVTSERMPWPTTVMGNVWILPGVPQIFAMKMPVVTTELGGDAAFVSLRVFTKLDEGRLKPLLDQVVVEHRAVEVGSYPQWDEPRYRTKITFDGDDAAAVEKARDAFVELVPAEQLVDPDD
jgi:molybdenum cofactor synthesis domain-containing protein